MSSMSSSSSCLIIFMLALIFFHSTEYLLSRVVHARGELLLSFPYLVAMSLALVEFTVESFLLTSYKKRVLSLVSTLGITMVLFGELMRKAAIIHAQKAFTLQVQTRKRQEHALITTGIYRYVRHPAYLGWTVWAVGTQFLLGNLICIPLFYHLAMKFFQERIPVEENLLASFFGEQWHAYRKKTPTYLPGIP